jgi:peptide/nickel transport system substrate-binding protein
MDQIKKINLKRLTFLFIVVIFSISITACKDDTQTIQDPVAIAQATFDAISTATAQAIPPTPTPVPVKPDIKICMLNEPNTLSNYKNPNPSALQVIQALSPQFVSQIGYQYQTIGLKEVPSIENSNIQIKSVEVKKGDWVIDRFGNPVQLMAGVQVIPSGCQSNECINTYQEGTLQMDQITILFNLQENLFWNDGTPLTANDSLFAYSIDQQNNSIGNPMLNNTASYQAISDYQLQWVGLPGYLKQNSVTAIWQPLPQHLYTQQPIEDFLGQAQYFSWGPYQLDAWEQGQSIKLISNPYSPDYATTYPNIEFKFVGENTVNNLASLSNNDCSILLDGTFSIDNSIANATTQTDYQIIPSGSKGWLHLDLALQHHSHDDGYNFYNDQPAFFADQLTRQAISQCIDREKLLAYYPESLLIPSYLSSNHPNAIENTIQYNPAQANQNLEQAGWILGEDGYRTSLTNYILYDTKLSLELTTESIFTQIAESIKSDLATCGVEVNLNILSSDQLYATTMDAPLFGRNFDLALFSWSSSQQDLCWLYQTQAIPGEDKTIHPYYWLGWNITGWSNTQFDDLCLQTQNRSIENQTQASQQAQQIFSQAVPSIPLIEFETFTAVRSEVCGFTPQEQGLDIQDFSKLGIDQYCQ